MSKSDSTSRSSPPSSSTTTYTTTRDGAEVTLRGAEAIAALRREMGRATGTAAEFRAQLLNTFEGQKTLLKGTLQTFAVVMGEPFAQVFRPMVRALVGTLNALLRLFQGLPGPLKRAFAVVTLVFGGFLTLVGGVLTTAGAITLMALVADTLVAVLGVLVAILAPAALAVTALAGVIAGFAVAFRRDVGGIASVARKVWSTVRLAYQGLVQLFEQGGFSGAVRRELGLAEHQGLRRFLINLYRIAHRARQIWAGFRQGFVGAIDAARPVFEQLVWALQELGGELGGGDLLDAARAGGGRAGDRRRRLAGSGCPGGATMRIRMMGDGRVFQGTPKQIVEAMQYIAFGQKHRTLSEYIDWSVEMARQMTGLEFSVEGNTDEEKATSFVEAMLEAGGGSEDVA